MGRGFRELALEIANRKQKINQGSKSTKIRSTISHGFAVHDLLFPSNGERGYKNGIALDRIKDVTFAANRNFFLAQGEC